MDPRTLVGLRITAQGLSTAAAWTTVHAAASAFGAHQGQDLPGVVASLALRTSGTVGSVLEAFTTGRIVRGYPMRGTVFAVAAEDLAWMTQLCADGPIRAAVRRRSQLGLEDSDVALAADILISLAHDRSAPGEGSGVPRAELFEAWRSAGIDPTGGRGYHLLVHLISTGEAAYGPWTGEETAVVDAARWLPAGSTLGERFDDDRVAATAELLRRYLHSHGPATLRDFAWWTKLPLRTIRSALPLVADSVEAGPVADDGEIMYWRPGLTEEYAAGEKDAMREFLLPGFDELVLGYPDRLALMDAADHAALVPGNNGVFKRAAIRRGRVVGIWTRKGGRGRRKLSLTPLRPVSDAQHARFERLFASFPYTAP